MMSKRQTTGEFSTSSFAFLARDTIAKNYTVVCLGEFVGTFFFLLLAFMGTTSVIQANAVDGVAITPAVTQLYISFMFGFSLAINVWIFYRISGGLFNPAVTLAFVITGLITPIKGMMMIVIQILAAIAASAVAFAMLPGRMVVQTAVGKGVGDGQAFAIEMFLTIALTMIIFMAAVEKHRSTHMAPLAIGLTLFVAHLAGIGWTGASLNPARSFGPAVVSGDFAGNHWVYWAGPVAGAVIAAGFYKLLKFIDYHTANPGQDAKFEAPAAPVDNLPKDESEGRGLTRTDTQSGYSVAGPCTVSV